MKIINFILIVSAMSAIMSCCQQQPQSEEQNAVIETIKSRRSIRNYQPQTVAKETLDIILDCGINAPNAINRQSWDVRVVNSPAVFEEIFGYLVAANPDVDPAIIRGSFRGAPTLVFVAYDPTFHYSVIDCGLLSENIVLSAWSLGVGSICLGSPIPFLNNSPEALERLGFTEGYQPILCIGLGYANEAPEAKPRDISKVKYVE